MKNSDEAIDKVLAGLRDTEPPAGLERRVLAAVHERAAAPRTLPLRWAALGGFALAAAAVIALFASPRHSPAPPAIEAIAQPQPETPATPHASVEPVSPRPRRHTPAIRANSETPAPTGNILTASFPAPPMPLTDQERLLLRIARRGEPQPAPSLDPDALAQQETHSEQVFETILASAEEPSIMKHKGDIR